MSNVSGGGSLALIVFEAKEAFSLVISLINGKLGMS